MRTFVALEVPEERVLREMVAVQEELRRTQADLKIVSRENLHFTVKFLGEITESQVSEVDERLKELDLEGAEVTVKGVGAFPNPSRPNVIWAGVAPEDSKKIVPIAERVISALRGIGETDNRPYQPHITLARTRSRGFNRELASFIEQNTNRQFGTVTLVHLKLKSSELTPRGPVYADVGVYALR